MAVGGIYKVLVGTVHVKEDPRKRINYQQQTRNNRGADGSLNLKEAKAERQDGGGDENEGEENLDEINSERVDVRGNQLKDGRGRSIALHSLLFA